MPSDPEKIEPMLRRIRGARELYSSYAEALREQGLDVDGFLADCDEFIAVLEGRHEGDFDVQDFLRRLNAFTEEAKEFMHIQEQVKAVEVAGELHDVLPDMEKMAAEYRERGEPMHLRTAAEIEEALARIRAGLAKGKLDQDALQDMSLALSAEMAELQRRIYFRNAVHALSWELAPPERWAKLSPEQKRQTEDLLATWREAREEVLGALPLEDRRRLEALRYEDFDKPGACEP